MRVLALASLLFMGAMASPMAETNELVTRADNAKAVSSGIDKIKADTQALDKTVNTIPAQGPVSGDTAATLLTQSNTLVTDIQASTASASSSSKFNYPETFEIAGKIIALEPVINKTLQDFVNKKPAFDNTGLTSVVLGQLQTQRQATSDFADALGPKLAAPFNNFAPLIKKQILGYFDTAIKAYSS